MRVVVAGASGLLGSTLVPILSTNGHEVLTLGRTSAAEITVAAYDKHSLSEIFQKTKPDAVVNLIAMTNVDECERAPDLAYQVNAELVQHLAGSIASVSSDPFLIHISTDQVYSGHGPHREEVVAPVNYYAYSKLVGEQYALALPSCVLRTNFFGRSECKTRQSLSDWLVGALRRQEPATVYTDILFSPLTMQTLATAICRCLESRKSGLFNLGSRAGASKADFAYGIARRLGLSTNQLARSPSPDQESRARRPKDMRLDSTKFETEFGVTLPTFDDEVALAEDLYGDSL